MFPLPDWGGGIVVESSQVGESDPSVLAINDLFHDHQVD